MNIIRYLIHKPIAVSMVTIAVVILGLVAIYRLPVSLLPDVDIPQITVQVSQPGSSATQMDNQIVRPLRSRLSQLTGLKDMQSVSSMDAATINLKFEPGSNADLIFIEVNEKIDMAMGALPKDIERPKVMKSSIADIPAFFVNLTLKGEGGDFAGLCNFASSVVKRRIEQLPQTAMVDISGTVGQKIMISPDYDKMRNVGLSTKDIERALADNDLYTGTLSIKDGQYRYTVHFDDPLLTLKDIAGIRLNHKGRIFRLDDFCLIERKTDVNRGWVRQDGKRAVTMAVVKQNDARMADLKKSIDETIADLEAHYPNIEFTLIRDQTQLLSFSIENLESNLIVGVVLTCMVLLLFMRNWRLALLVACTIPLSLVVTMLLFSVMNISLNVISLSGFILGVGMIVDNSIIVVDNVMQKWTPQRKLADVIPQATSEVFTPMLSSVLTTCSVFVPLIFLSGLAGELFYDQSVGISISLLTSLVVATTLVPVYLFAFYKHKTYTDNHTSPNRFDDMLARWYERTMKATMRHGRWVMMVFLLSIPGAVAIYWMIDKQRMPFISYDDIQFTVNWNEGISEEESDKRINVLIDRVKHLTISTSTMAGTQDFILAHTPAITSSEAVGYLKCPSPDALEKAQAQLTAYADSAFPRATLQFEHTGNPFDLMLDTKQSALEIRLKHDGQRPTVQMAQMLVDSLHKHFPKTYIPQVAVDNNLLLKANVWNMSLYNLSYSELLNHLREQTGTSKIMEINDGNQTVPIVIGTSETDRKKMMQSDITNSRGVKVPLDKVLRDSVVTDFKRLYASTMGEYYPIFIQTDGSTVRQIMNYTTSLCSSGNHEMTVSYEGDYFSSRELVKELMAVLSVALLLLFFIMAAQFESLIQPLIILSEIVFDCFIVLIAMKILDISLNLMSMIGIVVMSGIVINDSILKIDTINRLRRSGMSLLRAILTAGQERLRPILMTSATTMFAVLPFLSRGDIGSDLQYPLSITTIVGMSVGTLVSLFFVPLLYYVINKRHKG